jgi:Uma2 family endonuclease
MAEPARKLWTLDEFLAFDDGTDTHYELIGGEIFAMTPPADLHSVLAGRLGTTIGSKLKRPYEVAIEAGILLPDRADTYYQADLAVTCSRPTGQRFVAEPQVIVEILSPTTADVDYLRKLPDYRAIPSVEDTLLVFSTEPRIEHWRREADGWKVQDLRGEGIVRLQAFEVAIALADLYEDLLPAEGDRRAAG